VTSRDALALVKKAVKQAKASRGAVLESGGDYLRFLRTSVSSAAPVNKKQGLVLRGSSVASAQLPAGRVSTTPSVSTSPRPPRCSSLPNPWRAHHHLASARWTNPASSGLNFEKASASATRLRTFRTARPRPEQWPSSRTRQRFLASSWSDLPRPVPVYLRPCQQFQAWTRWYSRTPLRPPPPPTPSGSPDCEEPASGGVPPPPPPASEKEAPGEEPLAVTSAGHWRSAHRPVHTSTGSRPTASHLLTSPHQRWGTSTREARELPGSRAGRRPFLRTPAPPCPRPRLPWTDTSLFAGEDTYRRGNRQDPPGRPPPASKGQVTVRASTSRRPPLRVSRRVVAGAGPSRAAVGPPGQHRRLQRDAPRPGPHLRFGLRRSASGVSPTSSWECDPT
jgi:hypothetical protein